MKLCSPGGGREERGLPDQPTGSRSRLANMEIMKKILNTGESKRTLCLRYDYEEKIRCQKDVPSL